MIAARLRADRIDAKGADVLLEPRRPFEGQARPRLQHRRQPTSGAASDNPGVAAVGECQHLDDRRALAVPPGGEQDALVAPVHAARLLGQTGFVEERAPLPVLDLDHPEVGIEAALPAERGVDLGLRRRR